MPPDSPPQPATYCVQAQQEVTIWKHKLTTAEKAAAIPKESAGKRTVSPCLCKAPEGRCECSQSQLTDFGKRIHECARTESGLLSSEKALYQRRCNVILKIGMNKGRTWSTCEKRMKRERPVSSSGRDEILNMTNHLDIESDTSLLNDQMGMSVTCRNRISGTEI